MHEQLKEVLASATPLSSGVIGSLFKEGRSLLCMITLPDLYMDVQLGVKRTVHGPTFLAE